MLKNTTDNPIREDGEFIDEVGITIDPESHKKPTKLEVKTIVINSTTSPGSAIKPLKVNTVTSLPRD